MTALRWVARLLMAGLLVIAVESSAQDASLRLVYNNPATPQDLISIQGVLRGERRNWPDGVPVTVILPGRDAASYEVVGRRFFGSGGAEMQRHWLKMVFSGRSRAPQYVASDEEIFRLVESIPGAIGVTTATVPAGFSQQTLLIE